VFLHYFSVFFNNNFSEDEFKEAVKIVIKKYGKIVQKHVAKELGVSYPTYMSVREELGINVETVELSKRNKKLERKDYTEDEFGHFMLKMENRKSPSSYDIFKYKFDESLLLKPLADLHLGSDTVMYAKMWDDINFIKHTPNCKTILLGDYIDNFTKFSPGSAVYDQLMPPAEQKTKIEWIIKYLGKNKILGIIQGCFLKETLVVSEDYTMKPIEIVDKVLGFKEVYNVKRHWNNNYHKGEICRISYLGNKVFDIPATDNHPFIGIKRDDLQCPYREKGRFCKGINTGKFCEERCKNKPETSPKTIKAGDLEVGDFVFIPKPRDSRKEDFTKEDMKIFSWYLTEGSVIPEKAMTTFSFGIKDKEYAIEIQKLIETNHKDKISSTSEFQLHILYL
jgi:hypothetical protein